MTTIAWRGRTLAADTELTLGDDTRTFCRKLTPIKGGGCLAMSGNIEAEAPFKEWLSKGGDIAKFAEIDKKLMKKFDAIVIDGKKNVWWYDDGPTRFHIDHPFHAIGTGAQYAMAAMQLGASAKEAVLFAAESKTSTNAYVDTYDLQTHKVTLCKWPAISRSRWEKMRVE
jgi:hypothetical protein